MGQGREINEEMVRKVIIQNAYVPTLYFLHPTYHCQVTEGSDFKSAGRFSVDILISSKRNHVCCCLDTVSQKMPR